MWHRSGSPSWIIKIRYYTLTSWHQYKYCRVILIFIYLLSLKLTSKLLNILWYNLIMRKLGDPERCHNQMNCIRLNYTILHTFYYSWIKKITISSKIFHYMLDYIILTCIYQLSINYPTPHSVVMLNKWFLSDLYSVDKYC